MQPIEIDAAVAKALGMNVLGIALCFRHCGEYLVPFDGQGGNVKRPVYLYDCCCEFRKPNDADYFGHIAGCLGVVPEFSTDIKQAWKLVSKMPHFSLHRLSPTHWQCNAVFCGDWMDHFTNDCGCKFGDGETAPLAICRAFLKFMGEKDAVAS